VPAAAAGGNPRKRKGKNRFSFDFSSPFCGLFLGLSDFRLQVRSIALGE